jgi:hypothetical protein
MITFPSMRTGDIKPLSDLDQRHLRAAQGWVELGNHLEADSELDKIVNEYRVHPDVLEVRWAIYASHKQWEACVDIAETIINLDIDRAAAWIHRSFALHELKRTQEALDLLWPAVGYVSRDLGNPLQHGVLFRSIGT